MPFRWRMSGGGTVSLGEDVYTRDNNLPCPVELEDIRGVVFVRNTTELVLHIKTSSGVEFLQPYMGILWPSGQSTYSNMIPVKIESVSWNVHFDAWEEEDVPDSAKELGRYIHWHAEQFRAGRPVMDFGAWRNNAGRAWAEPAPRVDPLLQEIADSIARLIPPTAPLPRGIPPSPIRQDPSRPSIIDEGEAPRRMGGA